jgi:uncharacterized protein YkwD
MAPRRAIAVLPSLAIVALLLAFGTSVAAGFRPQATHHHRLLAAHAGRRAPHRSARGHAADQCSDANTAATSASREAMRNAVVCLINVQRSKHHLPALHVQQDLNRSAQGWTNVMVTTGQFTHGADFAGRISAAGYAWASAGENIATGFLTPQAVVKAWMASPDHCQNILDPGYADVGTGLSNHPLGQYGAATWTQDFGLWMGHRVPSMDHGPQRGCPYHI